MFRIGDSHMDMDKSRQDVHDVVDDIGKGLDGIIADVKAEVKKAQANFNERVDHRRERTEHRKADK